MSGLSRDWAHISLSSQYILSVATAIWTAGIHNRPLGTRISESRILNKSFVPRDIFWRTAG